jgi:hypothetical protein
MQHQILKLPLRNLFALDEASLPLYGTLDILRNPFLCLLEVPHCIISLLRDTVTVDNARTVSLLTFGFEFFIDLFYQWF